MKLTSRIKKLLSKTIVENKVSTARYIEVSNSLYSLSEIVRVMNDVDMSDDLKDKSDKLYNMAKLSFMSKEDFDKEMAKINLSKIFKDIQAKFKEYEKSNRQVKLGRKTINLKDVILNFATVSQKAKKDE